MLSISEDDILLRGTDSSGVPMRFDVLVAVTGATVGDFLAEATDE